MAWIRSQNKTKLLDVDNIRITHYAKETTYDIVTSPSTLEYTDLGSYSTKEKALKVLDMIQKYIGGKTKYYIAQDIGNPNGYHVLDDMNIPMCYCNNGIFEMPADEEV